MEDWPGGIWEVDPHFLGWEAEVLSWKGAIESKGGTESFYP